MGYFRTVKKYCITWFFILMLSLKKLNYAEKKLDDAFLWRAMMAKMITAKIKINQLPLCGNLRVVFCILLKNVSFVFN
jgi:hypothetical protein